LNKILVIAAHPDDEVLGVGGTIRKHVNNGATADCLVLGEGMTSRTTDKDLLKELHTATLKSAEIIGYRNIYFSNFPDNRFDSVDLLDIIKEVEKHIENLKPDIVYTYYCGDLNIDHRRTFEAVITACRPVEEYTVKEIYCFETPSSTEWNFKYESNIFKPNVFEDIEGTLQDKLNAILYYTAELREYPHPRSLKALEIIVARWGTVVGKNMWKPLN